MRFIKCENQSPETGFKVAVIGAGPAGLATAGELACKGHEVHVFDRFPEPGGMLLFVIPDFRFPKEAVRSGIKELEQIGVTFHTGHQVTGQEVIGLKREYDAIVIATGTWRSKRLEIKGEEKAQVIHALEWIHSYMLYKLGYESIPKEPGEKVIIIGAGLTAVDVCELLYRNFGITPILVYRRPLKIAPAGSLLAKLAEKGLIRVVDSVLPIEVVGSDSVEGLKVIDVKATEDRAKPVEPIPGTERTIEADTLFIAAGLVPTPPDTLEKLGIELEADGRIKVDKNMATNVKGIFAAGDVATGPSTVWRAMENGRKTAVIIDSWLNDHESRSESNRQ
ncbi:MAG: FAD-dependent oxidoreductase [Thermofilaceae archaeon]